MAIYLGVDELKDSWTQDEAESNSATSSDEDVEKYKKEISDLKEEIETLKKE